MPGRASSGSSTAHSRADSTTGWPATLTSRVAGLMLTPMCS